MDIIVHANERDTVRPWERQECRFKIVFDVLMFLIALIALSSVVPAWIGNQKGIWFDCKDEGYHNCTIINDDQQDQKFVLGKTANVMCLGCLFIGGSMECLRLFTKWYPQHRTLRLAPRIIMAFGGICGVMSFICIMTSRDAVRSSSMRPGWAAVINGSASLLCCVLAILLIYFSGRRNPPPSPLIWVRRKARQAGSCMASCASCCCACISRCFRQIGEAGRVGTEVDFAALREQLDLSSGDLRRLHGFRTVDRLHRLSENGSRHRDDTGRNTDYDNIDPQRFRELIEREHRGFVDHRHRMPLANMPRLSVPSTRAGAGHRRTDSGALSGASDEGEIVLVRDRLGRTLAIFARHRLEGIPGSVSGSMETLASTTPRSSLQCLNVGDPFEEEIDTAQNLSGGEYFQIPANYENIRVNQVNPTASPTQLRRGETSTQLSGGAASTELSERCAGTDLVKQTETASLRPENVCIATESESSQATDIDLQSRQMEGVNVLGFGDAFLTRDSEGITRQERVPETQTSDQSDHHNRLTLQERVTETETQTCEQNNIVLEPQEPLQLGDIMVVVDPPSDENPSFENVDHVVLPASSPAEQAEEQVGENSSSLQMSASGSDLNESSQPLLGPLKRASSSVASLASVNEAFSMLSPISSPAGSTDHINSSTPIKDSRGSAVGIFNLSFDSEDDLDAKDDNENLVERSSGKIEDVTDSSTSDLAQDAVGSQENMEAAAAANGRSKN